MTDKSPEAFRTISEVSEDLDLPQHVLRFWESKFSSIKPLKRGGGRRYYRPGDIDLLRGIRYLLYSEGFTIKGVQKILREQGVRHVANCWQEDADALAAAVATGFGEPERRATAMARPPAGGISGAGKSGVSQVRALKTVLRTLREAQSRLEGVRRAK
ncbi:MAG: MerR family transcriptional regulator [Hyphomicrobiales bacterium]|nr:MerR family transcriptional regulator [Hyphomicrobiales bacterium]